MPEVNTLTLTQVRNRDGDQWGRAWAKTWTVQGSTGYPTGGFTLTPQRFGLKSISAVLVGGCTVATAYKPQLIPSMTAPKLMYVNTTTGVEVGSTTNVSTPVFTLVFVGD